MKAPFICPTCGDVWQPKDGNEGKDKGGPEDRPYHVHHYNRSPFSPPDIRDFPCPFPNSHSPAYGHINRHSQYLAAELGPAALVC